MPSLFPRSRSPSRDGRAKVENADHSLSSWLRRTRTPSRDRRANAEAPGSASSATAPHEDVHGVSKQTATLNSSTAASRVPSEPAQQPTIRETSSPGSQVSSKASRETAAAVPSIFQEDLWDLAYKKLKKGEPKLFKAYQHCVSSPDVSNPPDATVIGLDALDHKERERYLAEKIGARLQEIRGKQSPIAAEAYKRIVSGVIFAKDFIAAAASTEPHAALAWAGVSMLLPLLLNAAEQDESAFKGLEKIADLMREYRVIEKTYRNSTSWLSEKQDHEIQQLQLEEKIISLYYRVLEFQMRMARHYAGSSPKRYFRDLIISDDWKSMHKAVIDLDERIQNDLRVIDDARIWAGFHQQEDQFREVLSKNKEYFEILQSSVSGLRHDLELEKEQSMHVKIREALKSDYGSLKDTNDQKVTGTSKWLLTHDKFLDWQKSENPRLLFLTAGPGCGKSVLMRSLVDNEIEPVRDVPSDRITCYFFFRDTKIGENKTGQSTSNSAITALAAMLHQIFVQKRALTQLASKTWSDSGAKFAADFSALWSLLVMCAKQERIDCILDALDECEPTSRAQLIGSLKDYYGGGQGSSHGLHFIVSGRPYFDSDYRFADLIQRGMRSSRIAIEDEDVGNETGIVISAQVDCLEELQQPMKTYLTAKLLNLQTDTRTYLWLKLLFDKLRYDLDLESAEEEEIDEAVNTAPTSLYDAYEQMLNRSPSLDSARKLLLIILGASQSLTAEELQVAFSIAEQAKDIKYDRLQRQSNPKFKEKVENLCGLFITFVDNKAYLIHQTAKEFLTMPQNGVGDPQPHPPRSPPPWKHSLRPQDAHRLLSHVCILFLNHPEFEHTALDIIKRRDIEGESDRVEPENRYKRMSADVHRFESTYVFLTYAALSWRKHYCYGSSKNESGSAWPAADETTVSLRKLCDISHGQFWAWYLCEWAQKIDQEAGIASWIKMSPGLARLIGVDLTRKEEIPLSPTRSLKTLVDRISTTGSIGHKRKGMVVPDASLLPLVWMAVAVKCDVGNYEYVFPYRASDGLQLVCEYVGTSEERCTVEHRVMCLRAKSGDRGALDNLLQRLDGVQITFAMAVLQAFLHFSYAELKFDDAKFGEEEKPQGEQLTKGAAIDRYLFSEYTSWAAFLRMLVRDWIAAHLRCSASHTISVDWLMVTYHIYVVVEKDKASLSTHNMHDFGSFLLLYAALYGDGQLFHDLVDLGTDKKIRSVESAALLGAAKKGGNKTIIRSVLSMRIVRQPDPIPKVMEFMFPFLRRQRQAMY